MDVQIRGRGVVVTDALSEYGDRKVNKLTKHFASLTAATVTLSIQGKTQRVEVQLEGDGITLRGEHRCDDLYAGMDHVVDKLERQMQKYKDRHKWHHRGAHHEHDTLRHSDLVREPEEPITGQLVRRKRFEIKPLSEQEAVAQMELLSHDFFVFENADNNEICVLYRREDGNYGLLEPER
jgi:putative sigma-54 modulation protein